MRKNLNDLVLLSGSHSDPSGGGCLMEVQAWFGTNGESHTDYGTPCVCPALRRYGIALNDRMPDDQRQRLKDFIPLLGGTRDGLERERGFVAVDRAVRVFAPRALDAAGLGDHAERLRALDPVVDKASAVRARDATNAAYGAAYSAYGAAAAAADAAADAAHGAAYAAARAANAADAAAAADAACYAACWDDAIQLFRDMIAVGAEDRVPPAWSCADEVTIPPAAECSPTVARRES